jgi:hypothetical protein
MSEGLPMLSCPRRDFAALSARVDSAPWRDLPPVDFRDAIHAGAPQQPTWVRTAWNEHEWRTLFFCVDRDPWATITKRDGMLYQEETVEVFFDPVGDLEGYYEIEVNPLNTVLDIVFRRSRSGFKGNWAWTCEGLQTRVEVQSGSWTVEISIPFAAVGETPRSGTRWRANFCRIDRPSRDDSLPRELTSWSPPRRESFHTPQRFGIVEFTD